MNDFHSKQHCALKINFASIFSANSVETNNLPETINNISTYSTTYVMKKSTCFCVPTNCNESVQSAIQFKSWEVFDSRFITANIKIPMKIYIIDDNLSVVLCLPFRWLTKYKSLTAWKSLITFCSINEFHCGSCCGTIFVFTISCLRVAAGRCFERDASGI